MPYRAKLATQGIVYGSQIVDHRPHIDLAHYTPWEIQKGAAWLPIGEPALGHQRQTGFYTESLKPNSGGMTVKHNVGTVTTWQDVDRRQSTETFNEAGVAVGPQWYYFPKSRSEKEQVSEIRVRGGITATPELLASKVDLDSVEILGFNAEGTVARWQRTEGDRLIDTRYGPAGQVLAERVTTGGQRYEDHI